MFFMNEKRHIKMRVMEAFLVDLLLASIFVGGEKLPPSARGTVVGACQATHPATAQR